MEQKRPNIGANLCWRGASGRWRELCGRELGKGGEAAQGECLLRANFAELVLEALLELLDGRDVPVPQRFLLK